MKKICNSNLAFLFTLALITGCTAAKPEPKNIPALPSEPQTEAAQEPESPAAPVEEGIAAETEPEPEAAPEAEVTYILNKNTKKFHKPACRSAELISPKNYEETCGSREEVLALGYTPCGNCRP